MLPPVSADLLVSVDDGSTVLPALPALESVAFMVGAESLASQKVREPTGTVCRLSERAAAASAQRHRTVGKDICDCVENRTNGPFAHGD
jgi:hypothetical protein